MGMKYYSVFFALFIATLTCSSLLAQDKAALQPNATVVGLLQSNAGKIVELHLRSGEKMGGKVAQVSDNRLKGRFLRCVPPRAQARCLVIASVTFLGITLRTDAAVHDSSTHAEREQVPTWSAKDMAFFLHGSMSAEVIPEGVLRAFIKTYPDLFATNDLTHLGLIPDLEFGWPIGISRADVKHLGGLPSLGHQLRFLSFCTDHIEIG